jgi:hypothetical protein
MDRVINCQNYRRFGVEIELNTADGVIRKLDRNKGETPFGADRIALLIRRTLRKPVEIQGWDHNYNNQDWIVKPDGSCGIEVCTPVLKGYQGLIDLVQVVETFRKAAISADQRCSLHVHVNIADLNKQELASVVAWYIKCEHVFMDSVPAQRKVNRYCQMLGMTDFLNTDFSMNPDLLLSSISNVKYYSLNAYHFMKGGAFDLYNCRKKTIEFRIGENAMCLDGLAVKNWVRLLLHFVDMVRNRPMPPKYEEGNPWTGLVWLEPDDVFKVLGFDQPCSEGINQIKSWFMKRIFDNGYNTGLSGIFSNEGRHSARQNFLKFFLDSYEKNDCFLGTSQARECLLYDKKYSK